MDQKKKHIPDRGAVGPEDYIEPSCVLCGEPYGMTPKIRTVPQQRIIEKMDEYMSRRDYEGAERHLLYWLGEARLGKDERGELLILGELIGHYRKTADREKALECSREALDLIGRMDYGDTVSAGTMYVNIATAYTSFGENEQALELFALAKAIYEGRPGTKAELLGGLYNNMALACTALGRYKEAERLYEQAAVSMSQVPGGELEQAITCLNLADAVRLQYGMDSEEGEARICSLVERAQELLENSPAPRDGYYAFVLEKCVPGFEFYGYFEAAERFRERSRQIYALA